MSEKLQKIRSLFNQHNIAAYLVPHNDAHNSEYLAADDERLSYISGFTGSNGIALITQNEAYLWTDSRYYVQAQNQLENGWVMKKLEKGEKYWFEIAQQTINNSKIGYDPLLISAASVETRSKQIGDNQLHAIEQNLVDQVWQDKQKQATKPIFEHELKFAGLSHKQKLDILRTKVKGQALLSYQLEEIAWILNLRGYDVKTNPVFKSFLIINFEQNESYLFIDENKIADNIKPYLQSNNIKIHPYDHIFQFVNTLNLKLSFNKEGINQRLFQYINPQNIAQTDCKAITQMKAVKNEREIQGFKDCHVRDGFALIRYFAWLENELNNGNNTITEYTGAEKLESFRREQELNFGLSFESISSVGANAAIVHYKPEKETAKIITKDQIYLLDSGGQYYDGTTDVTRTVHFGKPTEDEITAYTLVLQGNLDIELTHFPANSSIGGGDLDAIARRNLWMNGLNYGHGTGHGVGYFLNVHEGPHGLSKYSTVPYEPGMIVTNEPGYYLKDHFGIRIENVMLVEEKNGEFWGLRNLTKCPYDRNLIKKSLLSPLQIKLINNYNEELRTLYLQKMKEIGDKIGEAWLIRNTEQL